MTSTNQLSLVIPVFNEQDSLVELHRQIDAAAESLPMPHEIIFVDDGSTDDSWSIMKQLATDHAHVSSIRFRRNFGKAAALQAGVQHAKGSLIATMDADLQDDPAELSRMLEALDENHDVISGWKADRKDPIGKTLPSKVFNWLVGVMTGVKLHDHNCGFKLYRREVFDEVNLYGEMHRFVPVLAAARGFRIGELAVNHRARQHGASKYGWSRLPKGFLDLLTVSFLTGYNHRPQHVIGSAGLISLGLGAIGMVYMGIYWLLRMSNPEFQSWDPVHQRPMLLISLGAVLLGTQLLCMGFLAELIVSRNSQTNSPYTIREKVD